MRKYRLMLVASAVAAALAAPASTAQQRTDRYDGAATSATESRSGWRWWDNLRADWREAWRRDWRAEPGAWIQTDPDLYYRDRAWYWHPRAHIGPDNAYHSPTDGRTGGAGIPAPNGAVPSTSPLVASGEPAYPPSRMSSRYYGERYSSDARSTDPRLNIERSPTDGRAGGAGVPSSTSGAVPSTQPNQDAGTAPRSTLERAPTWRSDPQASAGDERNLTDGRSGGTNLPSPQSGATPSTSPGAVR